MKKCYDCTHVEMCGWRKEVKEQGCEFFDDGMVWIPVSERLPHFGTKVLVWVENKDQTGRFNKPGVYTANLEDKEPEHDPEGKRNFWGIPGYDSAWTVWAWSYFEEPDVKAWKPLPEPYKGGESNG